MKMWESRANSFRAAFWLFFVAGLINLAIYTYVVRTPFSSFAENINWIMYAVACALFIALSKYSRVQLNKMQEITPT